MADSRKGIGFLPSYCNPQILLRVFCGFETCKKRTWTELVLSEPGIDPAAKQRKHKQ